MQTPAVVSARARAWLGSGGVTQPTAQVDGGHGVVQALTVGELLLGGPQLVQVGPLVDRQEVQVGLERFQVGDGFPMAVPSSRLPGRVGQQPHHCVDVPSVAGMVGQAGRVEPQPLTRSEHLEVQLTSERFGQCVLDGRPGQFVPEGDRQVVHPHQAQVLRDSDGIHQGRVDLVQQGQLCPARHDRHQLDQPLALASQPRDQRAHEVTDGGRKLFAGAGHQRGHEERVAAGLLEDPRRHVRTVGQGGHRPATQWLESDAFHA